MAPPSTRWRRVKAPAAAKSPTRQLDRTTAKARRGTAVTDMDPLASQAENTVATRVLVIRLSSLGSAGTRTPERARIGPPSREPPVTTALGRSRAVRCGGRPPCLCPDRKRQTSCSDWIYCNAEDRWASDARTTPTRPQSRRVERIRPTLRTTKDAPSVPLRKPSPLSVSHRGTRAERTNARAIPRITIGDPNPARLSRSLRDNAAYSLGQPIDPQSEFETIDPAPVSANRRNAVELAV